MSGLLSGFEELDDKRRLWEEEVAASEWEMYVYQSGRRRYYAYIIITPDGECNLSGLIREGSSSALVGRDSVFEITFKRLVEIMEKKDSHTANYLITWAQNNSLWMVD
jgi:hypothetical protein